MEYLSPTLSLLMAVRRNLDQGKSLRSAVDGWTANNKGTFRRAVFDWKSHLDAGNSAEAILRQLNPWQAQLLLLIQKGLEGESIGKRLEAYEIEVIQALEAEFQDKMTRIPYLAMIPTLIFMLPAFLLLLFGPLMKNFLDSFGT